MGATDDDEPVGGREPVDVDVVVDDDVAVFDVEVAVDVDVAVVVTVDVDVEVFVVVEEVAVWVGGLLVGVAADVPEATGERDGLGSSIDREALGRFEPPPQEDAMTSTIAQAATESGAPALALFRRERIPILITGALRWWDLTITSWRAGTPGRCRHRVRCAQTIQHQSDLRTLDAGVPFVAGFLPAPPPGLADPRRSSVRRSVVVMLAGVALLVGGVPAQAITRVPFVGPARGYELVGVCPFPVSVQERDGHRGFLTLDDNKEVVQVQYQGFYETVLSGSGGDLAFGTVGSTVITANGDEHVDDGPERIRSRRRPPRRPRRPEARLVHGSRDLVGDIRLEDPHFIPRSQVRSGITSDACDVNGLKARHDAR